jgi:hypothetical protein
MTTMRDRIALAVSSSGVTSARSLKQADAVLDELMRPSEAMMRAVRDEITKRSAYSIYPTDSYACAVFQAAIRAAKDGK